MTDFFFRFGGKSYSTNVNSVPGATPFIFSHKDLYDMGLSYQTYHRTVERPENGYKEKAEMRTYLPHLVFPRYGFLSTQKLRKIHRNLGHFSVEKNVAVIENAKIGDLPKDVRKRLVELV